MPASENLIELRRLLAERFPAAHAHRPPEPPDHGIATGVPALDKILGGGLPRGGLAELVGAGPGSGSAQVIHSLLRRVAADGQFLALVDGADSFDVDAVDADVLSRLLWVRCIKADGALKAADLLLRDRNFPLVVLDLKLNSGIELRKIQSSIWFRFSRLLEQNHTTLLVVTRHQLVGGAACRVRVESGLGLAALAQPPSQVLDQLRFKWLGTAEPIEDMKIV